MSTSSHSFPAPGSKAELEEGAVLSPRFGADGLITCVTTDAATGEILMVAHMNARGPGEDPGDRRGLVLVPLPGGTLAQGRDQRPDPDGPGDAGRLRSGRPVLKVKVAGDGGCCHTGRRSCFYRKVETTGGEPRLVID